MRTTKDLATFVAVNDPDISRILLRRFYFAVTRDNIHDVKQDFYALMQRRKILERFDPNRGTAFSTFIFRCLQNHVLAYRARYTGNSQDAVDHSVHLLKDDPDDFKLVPHTKMLSTEDDLIRRIDLGRTEGILKGNLDQGKKPHRTTYHLLKRYKEGWKDKEIAQELEITIAGVGAIKRKLKMQMTCIEVGQPLSPQKQHRSSRGKTVVVGCKQKGIGMTDFGKHKDYEKRIKSSKFLMASILKASKDSDAYPQHITELLSVLLWKLTEANGKQNTHYWSKGFAALVDKDQGQHEHVNQRKDLIEELLADHSKVDDIEKRAIACMVTKEEHERLHHVDKTLTGWDRYKAAGIEVIDRWHNNA